MRIYKKKTRTKRFGRTPSPVLASTLLFKFKRFKSIKRMLNRNRFELIGRLCSVVKSDSVLIGCWTKWYGCFRGSLNKRLRVQTQNHVYFRKCQSSVRVHRLHRWLISIPKHESVLWKSKSLRRIDIIKYHDNTSVSLFTATVSIFYWHAEPLLS